jgi:hypothetical protein
LLEEKLVGRPDVTRLSSLSWHEHLLGCDACRALFESEETLEVLLATLPEPNLPPEIKRRVLVALARSKTADRALDRLLERGADVEVPAGFAQAMLARLDPLRREALREGAGVDAASTARLDVRLDALLDRAGAVVVPQDLARRTLQALEGERTIGAAAQGARSAAEPLEIVEARRAEQRASTSSFEEGRLDALLTRAGDVAVPEGLAAHTLSRLDPARRALARPRLRVVRSTWIYAAAAMIVAALLVWAMWPKHAGTVVPDMATNDGRAQTSPGAQSDGARELGERHDLHSNDDRVARAPDPKLLEAIDVLENWDLLTKNDVDVILSTVQPADELLLEYQDEG